MKKIAIDDAERRILRELQRDCSLSIAELAERVGLSQTPCWKRVKRLEAEGIIADRVAILNRDKLGVGVTLFVSVRTSEHDEAWLADFAKDIVEIPEVTEFYRMSGEVDYMLKVVCRDIADYDRIYKQIIRISRLIDVSSSFAMEQMKYTTEIPL